MSILSTLHFPVHTDNLGKLEIWSCYLSSTCNSNTFLHAMLFLMRRAVGSIVLIDLDEEV